MGRLVGRLILCRRSSARQFALISFSKDLFISGSQAPADGTAEPFTLEWQRTSDNPTPLVRKQESRPQLNLGELVRRATRTKSCRPGLTIYIGRAVARIPRRLWWWYTSCWSGGLWQSMSIWSHVRTYKGLEEVASEDQSWAKVKTSYSPSLYYANDRPDALLLHQPSLPLLSLLFYSPVVTASPTSPKSLLSSLRRHSRLRP